jgi:hypothetical protein
MSIVTRQGKGSRLTIQEMDGNFTYLESISGVPQVIYISLLEILTLIENNELVPLSWYKISGTDVPLYGGSTIYLQATSENTLSLDGFGEFYNPKYDQTVLGFNVWTHNGSYNQGDRVHWGGMTWINLNGNVGDSNDIYTLDSEWQVIPYNAIDYNFVIEPIKYDLANDLIIERNEQNTNIVSFNKASYDVLTENLGVQSPIKAFMWGNVFDANNSIGIGNQTIINSYNENVNFRGRYQQNIICNNESFQFNLTFDNGSSQQRLTFDKGSSQSSLTFDNDSNQQRLTFDNGSSQQSLTFDNGSYQDSLTFDNGSYQSSLTFDNNSGQQNLTFDNGSSQQNLTFDNGSSQSNLTFDNGSFQEELTFDNESGQSNLTFDNGSSQNNITFDNGSRQQNLTFDNGSNQTNITFDNGSRQQNLTFNGSYQDNLTFDNVSRQQNFTFDNGSFQSNLTFDNGSRQSNLTFDSGSYQNSLTFDNGSRQDNLTFDNNSGQQNLTFESAQLNYNNENYNGLSVQNVSFNSITSAIIPDLSSATILVGSQTYHREVYQRPDGALKIKFMNNLDALEVHDIDE